jgi:hypothetical protein
MLARMLKEVLRKTRRLRMFLAGLGLISLLGSKGKGYLYGWMRMRQREMEEEDTRRRRLAKNIKTVTKG